MLGLGVSEPDRAKNRRNEKQEMSYFPVCLRGKGGGWVGVGRRLMFERGPRKEFRQFIYRLCLPFLPQKILESGDSLSIRERRGWSRKIPFFQPTILSRLFEALWEIREIDVGEEEKEEVGRRKKTLFPPLFRPIKNR